MLEDSTDLHLSENGREQLQALLKYAPNLAIHCASGVGRTGMVRMIQAGMQLVDSITRMLKAGGVVPEQEAIVAKLLAFPETVLNSLGSDPEWIQWTTQAKPMLTLFLEAMNSFCKGELLGEDKMEALNYFFTRLLAGRRQIRFSVQEQTQMSCVFREVAMYHARMNLRFTHEQLQNLDDRLHSAFHPQAITQETPFVLQATDEDMSKYRALFEKEQNPPAERRGFFQRTFSSRDVRRNSVAVPSPENQEPGTGFALQRLTSSIASASEITLPTIAGSSVNPRVRNVNAGSSSSPSSDVAPDQTRSISSEVKISAAPAFTRRRRNAQERTDVEKPRPPRNLTVLPPAKLKPQRPEADNNSQLNEARLVIGVNPHLRGLFRGYENDSAIRLHMREYLANHPGLAIGRVDDRGDCFFEAIAFAWNQQNPGQQSINARHLRNICYTYANNLEDQAGRTLDNPVYRYFVYSFKRNTPALVNMTPEDVLINNRDGINKLYEDYLQNIQWTIAEINNGQASNGRTTPIWGEMELDGLILSQLLGLHIEVIGYSQHDGETVSQNEWIVPATINGFEFRANVHPERPADLDESKVIHLAVANLHFVPLVRQEFLQQADPQALVNPECVPEMPRIRRDTSFVDLGRAHFFGGSSRSSSGSSPSVEGDKIKESRAPSLRSSSSSDSE